MSHIKKLILFSHFVQNIYSSQLEKGGIIIQFVLDFIYVVL